MTINLIPWILMFLITLVWSAGVAFKPNSMGGKESWGPVNFKISILWWISILFVFLTKVSPFYFFIMVALSALIVSVASGKAEVDHAIKNKLPAESIMTRDQPNTEALLPSLLYYSVFLIILYFANDLIFGIK